MNIGKNKKTLLQFLEFMAVLVLVGSGVSPAAAALVNEVEPNNSVDRAQNIDGNFTLDFDENIGDTKSNTSTVIPHMTITGTGDNTFDHYSFMVTKAGDKGIFDIDSGSTDDVELDAYLQLFDSSGALLAIDDDSPRAFGQGGSRSTLDSYLEFTFDTPGVYVIQVGSCCAGTVDAGSDYQLQVSLENPLVVFDSFTIHKAEIRFDHNPSKETYRVKGEFTLAPTSDGIDPLVENVSVRVGTTSVTIPAGSFVADLPKFKFRGPIDGVDVKMVIEETDRNTFKFKVKAEGVDLTNTTNPPDMRLLVGNDGGNAPNIRLEGKLKFKVEESDDGKEHDD